MKNNSFDKDFDQQSDEKSNEKFEDICTLCQINKIKSDNILNFPYKKYESRWMMKNDLLKNIYLNRDYLFAKNNRYNSNIVHELMYNLVDNRYNEKKYRKQFIWGLEILSELEEYPILLNELNCNYEKPCHIFLRKAIYKEKEIGIYDKILNLVKIEEVKDLSPKNNFQKTMTNESVKEYHQYQDILFNYLIKNYNSNIRKCKDCNEILFIFYDLEKIASEIVDINEKNYVKDLLKKIIELRLKNCSDFVSDNETREKYEINKNHKHIIGYFEKMLEILK